jgi:GNAT superfamily N-acetyltransferase
MSQLESDTPVSLDRIVIRPLTAADTAAYRRLRQYVLDIGEGGFFSTSYPAERQLTTEQQWSEWLTETPVRCIIGFFIDGDLIGHMGAVSYGDPRYLTAELLGSWIAPKYRRTGLAKLGREKVREWCRERGYKYTITDIRSDNHGRMETRRKEGAVYVYTRPKVRWADGSTADAHMIMESLAPGTEITRSLSQAVGFVEAALAFVKHEQLET